ncbi:uncharacterized protein F4807DRAFT_210274 [Annulohypoxylon truncatum]|uniref:uncharacterized protein n=1 Tax=Annulohypoxylon truncatum TaxID=327061 RepID=UPI0020087695|nr:uncharacterized protein F4807DRAFT_210274 [Annulohypoxylon truncatum]KAI1206987.1 hypothetical protein F4807DRAFT_210274 [Annulohypoxylon truncatum]
MNFSVSDLSAAAAMIPPQPLSKIILSAPWKQLILPAALLYVGLCRALRFNRENGLRRKLGYPDRASLAHMTVVDAQQIIKFLNVWETPLFQFLALEFGLFKTYGVESISRLLLATGNLTDPVRSPKRFEDTAALIGEFMMNPPTSERAVQGIARMNFLHSRYVKEGSISNADLLYTLSVFIAEPERFARMYDWRPMNEMEYCAHGVFWKSVGDAMKIEYKGYLARAGAGWHDGIEFAEDVTAWAKSYEVVAMKPSTVCAKPARALIPMITYWAPWFAKPWATQIVLSLMGDRVRDAFMLPEPDIAAVAITHTLLTIRRFVVRYLTLPRFFEVKRLGPQDPKTGRMTQMIPYGNYPFYIKPTLWNRWGPLAWVIWMYGGKVPGDNPEEYMPQGYLFSDIGPKKRMGQGIKEAEADADRIRASGWSGCPF